MNDLNRVILIDSPQGVQAIDISSHDKLQMVALAVVKARWDDGEFPEPTPPVEPKMTKRKIKDIPDEQIRAYGYTLWQRHQEQMAKYEQSKGIWQRVKTCVETEDGSLAIQILHERRRLDGERFQIFDVQTEYNHQRDL